MSKDQKKINGLVAKMQEGDTAAFGELYDLFLADIYRFIFYKVTHRELAEDLTEDTFFKVWQNIDSYQQTKHPFSSWLYKIAHNTVIDYMRKEKVEIHELVFDVEDESMQTTALAEQHFNQQFLQRALASLPEVQREAIILKYVNDLNYPEIAEVLDKSETAVRTLISRGISKLKETIERLENESK